MTAPVIRSFGSARENVTREGSGQRSLELHFVFELLKESLDHVIHAAGIGGNIHLPSVHLHMTVRDKLAGRSPCNSQTQVIDNAVQTGLQDLQHCLACDAALLQRATHCVALGRG